MSRNNQGAAIPFSKDDAAPLRAARIQKELKALGDVEKAKFFLRFFKTGPGQYGEKDLFRGIKVPDVREVTRKFLGLPFGEAKSLLASPYHEDRLAALIILTHQFSKGDDALRQAIYDLYLKGAEHVNSWDLVDGSAPHILGAWLESRSKAPLYRLAKSKNMWERRMAMLATLRYIKQGRFEEAIRIADILVNDKEDLMHKAVGWMLREIGKKNREVEETFLEKHHRTMPRTMLRYAIELFPEERRKAYLRGLPK